MPEDKMVLYLRDLAPHLANNRVPVSFLVSASGTEEDDLEALFARFIEEAAKKLSGMQEVKSIDVYMGIWAQQFSFHLPYSLCLLLSEYRLNLTIDFND